MNTTEAIEKLKTGNIRYLNYESTIDPNSENLKRVEQVAAQHPFAMVLGCADSRVPIERIFSAGLGELFVVRVAGNVVDETALASLEFGAAKLATPLLLVLGHSKCGAVNAALDCEIKQQSAPTPALQHLVEKIKPAASKALQTDRPPSETEETAIELNVRHTMDELVRQSDLLASKVKASELAIVGGIYELASGKVRFLD